MCVLQKRSCGRGRMLTVLVLFCWYCRNKRESSPMSHALEAYREGGRSTDLHAASSKRAFLTASTWSNRPKFASGAVRDDLELQSRARQDRVQLLSTGVPYGETVWNSLVFFIPQSQVLVRSFCQIRARVFTDPRVRELSHCCHAPLCHPKTHENKHRNCTLWSTEPPRGCTENKNAIAENCVLLLCGS